MNALITASVMTLSLTLPATAQTLLSEQQALDLGMQREAVQQRLAGEIARGQSELIAARHWPNPELEYSRERLNSGTHKTEQTFAVSQRFDFTSRRTWQQDAAQKHLNAAQANADAWRLKQRQTIRQHFFSALHRQQQRVVYERTQQRLAALVSAVQRRRREGDVSVYDYQRIGIEQAMLQTQISQAQTDYQHAWEQLRAVLGDHLSAYDGLQGDMLPDTPVNLVAVSDAVARHPELIHWREQSAGYALQQRAAATLFPEVKLGVGVKREDDNGTTANGIVFSASLPLPLFDKHTDRQILYGAQTQIADSEYRLLRDTLMAELHTAHRQWQSYRDNALAFRSQTLPLVQTLVNTAELYYRGGEIGILELLDAYRNALQIELAALEQAFKARLAQLQLDYRFGGTLP